MTYAELLKSQGASDEEIKTIATPLAERAFAKMQADAEAARQEAQAVKEAAERDKAELNQWWTNKAVPEFKEMERRSISAEAEAAKARAAWQAAQERGLIDVAQLESLGYKKVDTPAAQPVATPPVDTSKFLTREAAIGVLDNAGEGLAALQDMVMEHAVLFPDRPLKVRDLRREATAAGKDPYSFWESKYQVPAAREAREKKIRDEYETKLRKEGHDAAVSELAGKYSNPDIRPMVASASPFTRKREGNENRQPWETGEAQRADARVAKATQKYLERQNSGVTH